MSRSFYDSLLTQVFFADKLLLMVHRLLSNEAIYTDGHVANGDSDGEEGQGAAARATSHMYRMPVPRAYDGAGRTFGDLFRELLAGSGLVALGLFRSKEVFAGCEPECISPFVFTCPRADTVVDGRDSVFVLGTGAMIAKYDTPVSEETLNHWRSASVPSQVAVPRGGTASPTFSLLGGGGGGGGSFSRFVSARSTRMSRGGSAVDGDEIVV